MRHNRFALTLSVVLFIALIPPPPGLAQTEPRQVEAVVEEREGMIVGIPKESWVEERRVALTPAGVYALVKAGHTVMVQTEAGLMSGFSDQAFAEAGARIAVKPVNLRESSSPMRLRSLVSG